MVLEIRNCARLKSRKAKLGDHQISTLSEHKELKNLSNYDPVTLLEEYRSMEMAWYEKKIYNQSVEKVTSNTVEATHDMESGNEGLVRMCKKQNQVNVPQKCPEGLKNDGSHREMH